MVQGRALRMAREAHNWALAITVMLEGHIKCLHCSTSCRQHQSLEHPLGHL